MKDVFCLGAENNMRAVPSRGWKKANADIGVFGYETSPDGKTLRIKTVHHKIGRCRGVIWEYFDRDWLVRARKRNKFKI